MLQLDKHFQLAAENLLPEADLPHLECVLLSLIVKLSIFSFQPLIAELNKGGNYSGKQAQF